MYFCRFWILLFIPVFLLRFITTQAETTPLHIIAAEKCYGDIAAEIGGKWVIVTSILSSKTGDPHDFQVEASTVKKIQDADLVIYNGLGYDSWIEKSIQTSTKPHCCVINVANLIGAKRGDNPHLWFNLNNMVILAQKLGEILHHPKEAATFQESLRPLFLKIEQLGKHYPNTTVTATEPVVNLLLQSLHFQILNIPYQYAIMNGTEPTFQERRLFEETLKKHQVSLFFYNRQATSPECEELKKLAEQENIPIIGVEEQEPLKLTGYQEWITQILEKIENNLPKKG